VHQPSLQEGTPFTARVPDPRRFGKSRNCAKHPRPSPYLWPRAVQHRCVQRPRANQYPDLQQRQQAPPVWSASAARHAAISSPPTNARPRWFGRRFASSTEEHIAIPLRSFSTTRPLEDHPGAAPRPALEAHLERGSRLSPPPGLTMSLRVKDEPSPRDCYSPHPDEDEDEDMEGLPEGSGDAKLDAKAARAARLSKRRRTVSLPAVLCCAGHNPRCRVALAEQRRGCGIRSAPA
jgi:hypothetical protein